MDLRRTGRTLIVAGLLFGALSANDAWGQAAGQAPAGPQADAKRGEVIDTSTLPVSLDRIRQGVQRESKLTLESIDPDIPVFRTSVRQTPLKLEDYWKIGPDTAVADYVRPFFASQLHYDYIKMSARENVATDPFGSFGNPLQPMGPPVLPIVNGITKGLSNIKRGRIKRQVEAELKAIEANQPAPEDSQQESQPEDAKKPRTAKPTRTAKPQPSDVPR
jgi:hypothetical protein